MSPVRPRQSIPCAVKYKLPATMDPVKKKYKQALKISEIADDLQDLEDCSEEDLNDIEVAILPPDEVDEVTDIEEGPDDDMGVIPVSDVAGQVEFSCTIDQTVYKRDMELPTLTKYMKDASKRFFDIAGSHPNALLRAAVDYQPPPPTHFLRRPRNVLIDPPDALTATDRSRPGRRNGNRPVTVSYDILCRGDTPQESSIGHVTRRRHSHVPFDRAR
ncbi:hypothetical protein EVAR_42421_1 [Eumeta japonica]|uniref:Uncharacterized protein n=1 Tax=Eumeta variegata TaxID=151549 RepID=A0A4C1X6U1_EUMVA|nr:hypothetical protein EVAR_42421_1 [Eumeta japonica]